MSSAVMIGVRLFLALVLGVIGTYVSLIFEILIFWFVFGCELKGGRSSICEAPKSDNEFFVQLIVTFLVIAIVSFVLMNKHRLPG